jgi:hypothetical protein
MLAVRSVGCHFSQGQSSSKKVFLNFSFLQLACRGLNWNDAWISGRKNSRGVGWIRQIGPIRLSCSFLKKYAFSRVKRVEFQGEKCHTVRPLKEIISYGKEN